LFPPISRPESQSPPWARLDPPSSSWSAQETSWSAQETSWSPAAPSTESSARPSFRLASFARSEEAEAEAEAEAAGESEPDEDLGGLDLLASLFSPPAPLVRAEPQPVADARPEAPAWPEAWREPFAAPEVRADPPPAAEVRPEPSPVPEFRPEPPAVPAVRAEPPPVPEVRADPRPAPEVRFVAPAAPLVRSEWPTVPEGRPFKPASSSPPTTPIPSLTPVTWTVLVAADRVYYDRMKLVRGLYGLAVDFPVHTSERRIRLVGKQMRIGRRSAARDLKPEIDLADQPVDPGVSRLHAVLIAAPDGTWAILDPGSANGTLLNGQEIATGDLITLHEGDRINLGAWTVITVHRG